MSEKRGSRRGKVSEVSAICIEMGWGRLRITSWASRSIFLLLRSQAPRNPPLALAQLNAHLRAHHCSCLVQWLARDDRLAGGGRKCRPAIMNSQCQKAYKCQVALPRLLYCGPKNHQAKKYFAHLSVHHPPTPGHTMGKMSWRFWAACLYDLVTTVHLIAPWCSELVGPLLNIYSL